MEQRITIPHCYKWMAAGNKDLYISYIKGFVKSSYPGFKPVRVEGDSVICTKK